MLNKVRYTLSRRQRLPGMHSRIDLYLIALFLIIAVVFLAGFGLAASGLALPEPGAPVVMTR